jgi:shikimate kinase
VAGKALAARLEFDFVDLDERIEQAAGRSILDTFRSEGEQAFRSLESQALAALSERDGMVLATGGGVVLSAENREMLKKLGKVVWLQVEPDVAIQRLAGSHVRPPLTDLSMAEEAREIAGQREGFYREIADHQVATDGKSAKEVCDELEQLWHTLRGNHVR